MNSVKIAFALLVLTLTVAGQARSEDEKEKDSAVPAFSDLQLLGNQNGTAEALPNTSQAARKPLIPLPEIQKLREFDINHDSQLNDFDVKQFQSIIESLNGEQLTGLQIIARFRNEQKNQKESFSMLYDLNQDGLFAPSDVDYFTQIINGIDGGAVRGNELIQKFKLQIFPKENQPK